MHVITFHVSPNIAYYTNAAWEISNTAFFQALTLFFTLEFVVRNLDTCMCFILQQVSARKGASVWQPYWVRNVPELLAVMPCRSQKNITILPDFILDIMLLQMPQSVFWYDAYKNYE
jgi:hypothetical protein